MQRLRLYPGWMVPVDFGSRGGTLKNEGATATVSYTDTESAAVEGTVAPGATVTLYGTQYLSTDANTSVLFDPLDLTLVAVAARMMPATVDQTEPADRDMFVYSAALGAIRAVPQADVILNSLNFPGVDASGATSSGAAIDAAIAACIPDTDPATTTRNATRRLHIPPGTYMRDDGQPVLALRSVQGFNLRTGGPWATKFVGAASARAVVEFNGVSRSHFDGFSIGTSGTPTIQRGVWIYWDDDGLDGGLAHRSTLESRWEFIESSSARCVTGMQIGRDTDTNQVDSCSFGHVMLQGSARRGAGTVASGSPVVTSVTGGTFAVGDEIRGAGIPAGATIISTGAGTFTMSANATASYTAGSLHAVLPGLDQRGLKVGHGQTANNLLHCFQFLATMSYVSGLHAARSGFTVLMWQTQNNSTDLLIDGPPNGTLRILSGRSETSQRFIDSAGFGNAFGSSTIESFLWNAQQLAADGQWVRYYFPGLWRFNNITLMSPPAGRVAKILATPGRRLQMMAHGLSIEGATETDAFSLNAAVAADVRWVDNAAAAVTAGDVVPSVASAATVSLPFGSPVVKITGTTTITSLTAPGHAGRRVTLIFGDVLTFTDGSNLKLAGNFTTAADATITLVCDGTNWYEEQRSTN